MRQFGVLTLVLKRWGASADGRNGDVHSDDEITTRSHVFRAWRACTPAAPLLISLSFAYVLEMGWGFRTILVPFK